MIDNIQPDVCFHNHTTKFTYLLLIAIVKMYYISIASKLTTQLIILLAWNYEMEEFYE